IGRLMRAAKETNTILILTADHGNADELFEVNKKTGELNLDVAQNPKSKTSHTLAPVPFAVFNSEILKCPVTLNHEVDFQHRGLANIAASVLELCGIPVPAHYEPSLVKVSRLPKNPSIEVKELKKYKQKLFPSLKQVNDEFKLAQKAVIFSQTISALRHKVTGCPWDKEQTFTSLKRFVIEEAYEVVDAVEGVEQELPNAIEHLQDELGDLLLQVYLYSEIAREAGYFDIGSVLEQVNKKMLHRHPHVFDPAFAKMTDAQSVDRLWDQIKAKEKSSGVVSGSSVNSGIFKDVLKKSSLPTLMYGCEISKISNKIGFNWESIFEVFQALESEVLEIKQEIYAPSIDWSKVYDELGDLIYTICNFVETISAKYPDAPKMNLDFCARNGYQKFLKRFAKIEETLAQKGTPLTIESAKNLSLSQWESLWNDAKKKVTMPSKNLGNFDE
ncbi:MAG: nucleoside triphosphate pyrophosphohydrolase, partial [Silvanigrellaceae bacterium]|nr:nucleoside triphosphate pyrophosphohydrolase [Silvanigrellaceae bacterium]